MTITTEELRKLVEHANERTLRVMPIDADMVASISAELITARAKLEAAEKLAEAGMHLANIADHKMATVREVAASVTAFRSILAAWEAAQ